jgi:hypothetical protein
MATKNIRTYLKVFFIVSLIILYIGLYLLGSFLGEGETGMSDGIKMSKGNGVFMYEYYLEGDSLLLSNNIYFHFGEIWAEQKWSVGTLFHPIKKGELNPYSNYGIYMEIPSNQKERFYNCLDEFRKAAIQNSENHIIGYRGVNNKLFLYIDYAKIPGVREKFSVIIRTDTLKNNIIPRKWSNPRVISNFYLIRK